MDCISHGTQRVSFILTLTSRKTTSTALNHSLHPCASNKMLSTTHVSPCAIICVLSSAASKVSLYIFLQCILIGRYCAACSCNNFLLLFFQMATLNFNHILLMLADQGSILQDTLQSQDGLN